MAALVAPDQWAVLALLPVRAPPRPTPVAAAEGWTSGGATRPSAARPQPPAIEPARAHLPVVLAAGAVGAACRLHKCPLRGAGRRATITRRALELPVKEPEVKTTVALPGADLKEETRQKRADKYRLLLFNDPLNKREFVARCLMTICLLKEKDAYQVMMKAHTEGVAVVGTYQFETAEAYCEGLKTKGLTVDIIAADDDN
uniref:Adaptor protein ClpS core domain-containing protein n=1 Tax=Pyrodinium bahamense TaxID=73915 RepID=A0A7S0ASR3_9DINO